MSEYESHQIRGFRVVVDEENNYSFCIYSGEDYLEAAELSFMYFCFSTVIHLSLGIISSLNSMSSFQKGLRLQSQNIKESESFMKQSHQ